MYIFILTGLLFYFLPINFAEENLYLLLLYLLFSTSLWFYTYNTKESLIFRFSQISTLSILFVVMMYGQGLLYKSKLELIQSFQNRTFQNRTFQNEPPKTFIKQRGDQKIRKNNATNLYTFEILDDIIHQNQTRFLIKIISVNQVDLKWYQQPKLWLYKNDVRSRYQKDNRNKQDDLIFFKSHRRYQAHLNIKQISGKRNDAGFDAELSAIADGIQGSATLSSKKNSIFRLLLDSKNSELQSLDLKRVDLNLLSGQNSDDKKSAFKKFQYEALTKIDWRQRYYNKIVAWFDSTREKSLLLALSFADRIQLSKSDWGLFRNLGLSHLLAISGLHIGLAMALGYYLGRSIQRLFFIFGSLLTKYQINPMGRRSYFFIKGALFWFPLLLGLAFAIGYASLAGFSLPTFRALISCFYVSILLFYSYQISHWKLWGYTLMSYLLIDPFSPLEISFWLSFGAVVILASHFTYQQRHYHFNQERSAPIYISNSYTQWAVNRLPHQIKQLVGLQFLLCLVMLPIQTYFFYGISLFAPLINLFVIPYVSLFTVPPLLLGLFCGIFNWPLMDQIGSYLFYFSDYSLVFLRMILVKLPSYWIMISDREWLYATLIIISILFLYYGLSRRFALLSLFILIVIQNGSLFKKNGPKANHWALSVVDVGQGLAILIEKEGKVVIYDTGISWKGGSMAESVLHPMLHKRGISQLDGLILSHSDNDHAGGRGYLEENFKPLWKRSSDNRREYLQCKRGSIWVWQNLEFIVLSPRDQSKKADNNNSCVILIRDEGMNILLTGDIEAKSEIELTHYLRTLDQFNNPDLNGMGLNDIDILIVPHHGSATSSTETLLKQIHPKLAIASVGRFNSFGHPSKKIVERYEKFEIPFLTTAEEGQITVQVENRGWKVIKQRDEGAQRWYRRLLN